MQARVQFQKEDDGTVSRTVSNAGDVIAVREPTDFAAVVGVDVLSAGLLEQEDLEAVGAEVLSAAFGPNGAMLFDKLRRSAGFSGTPLEIEVFENADIPETCCIPWELMHDGHGFLGASAGIHLVRRPVQEEVTAEQTVSARPQLLYCWSLPPGVTALQLEREQISLEWALAQAKSEDRSST